MILSNNSYSWNSEKKNWAINLTGNKTCWISDHQWKPTDLIVTVLRKLDTNLHGKF